MGLKLQRSAPGTVAIPGSSVGTLGRNAMKAGHLALEGAVVGVGVLNGEGMIDDPNASAEIGASRGDLRPLGEAALDRIALGAQHGIGVEDRRQHPRKGLGVGFRHNRIGCCRAALTHHH
jgi:hypothetical protein